MGNELDPQCFKGTIGLAVTNRGQLIPCCRCDVPQVVNDPEFKKLLETSYIADYNDPKDILKTKYWKRFYKNLKRNIGPICCHQTCGKNKSEDEVQVIKHVDVQNGTIIATKTR
jgi:hypothetical protein